MKKVKEQSLEAEQEEEEVEGEGGTDRGRKKEKRTQPKYTIRVLEPCALFQNTEKTKTIHYPNQFTTT